MEIIMKMSQGKGIVDDAGSINTTSRTQGVTEIPTYTYYHFTGHAMPNTNAFYFLIPPLVSTPQETCPPSVPSRWVHIYPYIPLPMVSSPPMTQAKVNP